MNVGISIHVYLVLAITQSPFYDSNLNKRLHKIYLIFYFSLLVSFTTDTQKKKEEKNYFYKIV